MQTKEYSLELGGKKITATFTDLADQTNGSVIIKCGEAALLATAVMSKRAKEGANFFPLVVDYEERFYAAGKIMGSQYVRREGRPSEKAILNCRIIDRTIRPLFDQYIRNEVQVVVTALAVDDKNDLDTLAILGASLALSVSNIPWHGPVGAVRILKNKEGAMLVNPDNDARKDFIMDAVVCGKDGHVNMIETEAKEATEDDAKAAFELAISEIKKLEDFQKMIVSEIGKKKAEIAEPKLSDEEKALFAETVTPKLRETVFAGPGSKLIDEILDGWLKVFAEKFPTGNKGLAEMYFNDTVDVLIHNEAVEKNTRPDGRKMNELRQISAKAGGISASLHGTGIFYRGGTHIFSALTLGGPDDALQLENMDSQGKKYFYHHYNFPPFSTGETGRLGGTNRRSIGHGALAEKAIRGILPSRDVFPYTIRLVSEAMASNGSTSMGSVCGSTLALMDGGVPILRPAAGIAMGLMMLTDGRYKVLTDIQGPEDHHGDMDFKVAGTKNGITAIQLDIKVGGIPVAILAEALIDAKAARGKIIDVIEAEIAAPRADLALSAPRILSVKIDPAKIGTVIGSGGKTIHKITDDTGAEISIEEDGTVFITGKAEGALKAKQIVEDLTREIKVGDKFTGEVVKIMDFGAFVRLGQTGNDGMVHISELAPFRVNNVTDVVKEGDVITVVVKEVDKERGKFSLSLKDADPEYATRKGVVPGAPSAGGFSGGDRPRFGSDRPRFGGGRR